MKILNIEIKGFKPFEFLSHIDSISLTAVHPIQIIIGSNGSGKSCLLRELIPYAPTKTIYQKTGYKKIEIEHNNSTYTLISDFSNKGKIHSFIKDDVDLNISGVAAIQNELVETHLGYNQLINDVIHYKYQISTMSKADRKILFMNINPIDLSIVLEKHKYVCTKLRECKSNITLLYRRKQDIEIKLISNELREEKYQKQKELETMHTAHSNEEYHISQLLNDYRKQCSTISTEDIRDFDISTIKAFRLKVLQFLKCNQYISNIDIDIALDKIHIDLGTKSEIQKQATEQAKNILAEIETYESHLSSLNIKDSISTLEKKLKENKKLLQSLPNLDKCIELPFDQQEYYNNIVIQLNELVSSFCIMEKKHIVYREIYEKLVNKLQAIKSMLLQEHKEKEYIRSIINEVLETKQTLPKEPVRLTEECTSCSYRGIYIQQVLSLENKQKEYAKKLEVINSRIKKYTSVEKILSEICETQTRLSNIVDCLYTLLEPTKFLYTKNEIISELNNDSTYFLKKISVHVDMIPIFYEKKELEMEVSQIEQQLLTMEKTKTPSLEFLQNLITKKKSILIHFQEVLELTEKSIQQLHKKKYSYIEYTSLQDAISQYQKKLIILEKNTIIIKSIEFYEHKLQECIANKNQVMSQLRAVTMELKEQESLLARYNEEVLAVISQLEKDKQIYEELEFSISPSTGFPYKNMINHINVLINNTNCILNNIWNHHMRIIPLTYGDELNYSFKVEVGTGTVNDISDLSKAEQVVMDIAFTLALIASMNLCDYPLFLDEPGDGFSKGHIERLLEWLRSIVDQKLVSQLWMVNHDAVLYEGFTDSDVTCLMEADIDLPEKINQYTKIM